MKHQAEGYGLGFPPLPGGGLGDLPQENFRKIGNPKGFPCWLVGVEQLGK